MSHRKQCVNRRQFLAASAGACAAPLVFSNRALGRDGFPAPNSKLNVVVIGIGSRGGDIIGGFGANPSSRIIGVCDCNAPHAERGKRLVDNVNKDTACVIYPKYEDVLADANVDIVACVTPDHWHTKIAVESCLAGKDIFCEKPLTLTLAEGRQIVAAARKTNRVCCSGSQRVWEDYGNYMAPVIQSGAIGDVKEIFVNVGGPPIVCDLPEEPIPAGMDWERWLGQAPIAPYNAERCSGSYGGGWRRYTEYCNGFLADWGAHKFGGALYSIGKDLELPTTILPPNCEGNPNKYLTLVFADGLKIHHVPGSPHDITYVGTKREFRAGDKSIKPLKLVDLRRYSGGTTNLINDFVYCVQNRQRPFQDFAYGATTAAVCQLANIGYKLGRPLQWDAAAFRFISDEEADKLISRPQRAPYTVPQV